jgi:hypothetical protein
LDKNLNSRTGYIIYIYSYIQHKIKIAIYLKYAIKTKDPPQRIYVYMVTIMREAHVTLESLKNERERDIDQATATNP